MIQPKIEGVGHGVPRMLYASDGSNWYAIKVRDSGILEVCSKDGDKIFGFESIVEEAKSNSALAAGTNYLVGTAVGTGKVWKITQVSMAYVGTTTNVRLLLEAAGLASDITLLDVRSITSGLWYMWSGEVYLQVGDLMRLTIEGATLNNDAYLKYAGIQMNAP